MRMKKIISYILILVLLASAVPLAATPAGAQQAGIPCDANGNNELTKDELVDAVLPYMLAEGGLKLDDVGDAAYVHAYWGGKPRTITDSMGNRVTIYRPGERIVVTITHHLEMLRSIGVEENRVVGVSESVIKDEPFFPEYKDKPLVESTNSETIMNQYPDVVLLLAGKGYGAGPELDKVHDELESVGITVIRVYCGGTGRGDIPTEAKMLGYILDKQDEADEFIDWYENIMNLIKTTVDGIEDEDKPKVYFEAYKWYSLADSCTHTEHAGGKNIFPDTSGDVSPEAVMKEKPDIIVKYSMGSFPKGCGGYHLAANDTAELEEMREEIMSRNELKDVVPAEGRVYVITRHVRLCASGTLRGFFLQPAYQAKWFHPDLFDDLDPKAIHQEYLTRFQGLDIDLDEEGVFVYPEEPI